MMWQKSNHWPPSTWEHVHISRFWGYSQAPPTCQVVFNIGPVLSTRMQYQKTCDLFITNQRTTQPIFHGFKMGHITIHVSKHTLHTLIKTVHLATGTCLVCNGRNWHGLTIRSRSAPKIFCALSDTLEWIFLQAGISSCLHHLDDFLTLEALNSWECQKNLSILLDTCSKLGILLAREKHYSHPLLKWGWRVDIKQWRTTLMKIFLHFSKCKNFLQVKMFSWNCYKLWPYLRKPGI